MKKLLLIVYFMLISVTLSFATPVWQITTLNSSTYTAVEVPDAKCGNVAFYVSDNSQIYIAKDSSGINERQTAADMIGESWGRICPAYGTKIIFYAKSISGTPDVIVLFNGN